MACNVIWSTEAKTEMKKVYHDVIYAFAISKCVRPSLSSIYTCRSSLQAFFYLLTLLLFAPFESINVQFPCNEEAPICVP